MKVVLRISFSDSFTDFHECIHVQNVKVKLLATAIYLLIASSANETTIIQNY